MHLNFTTATICNVRFADDIDLMGGSNGDPEDLTNRLVDTAKTYGMEAQERTTLVQILA